MSAPQLNKNRTSQVQIKIGIDRIALVYKSEVNMPMGKSFEALKDDLEYSYDISSVITPDEDLVQITVHYQFLYREDPIFEMKVENDYKVYGVNEVFSEGKILNEEFFQNLIAMSVNHARGIQCTLNQGTAIEKHYMPRINKKVLRLKSTTEVPPIAKK